MCDKANEKAELQFICKKRITEYLLCFQITSLRIITSVSILVCYALPHTDLKRSHFDSF